MTQALKLRPSVESGTGLRKNNSSNISVYSDKMSVDTKQIQQCYYDIEIDRGII